MTTAGGGGRPPRPELHGSRVRPRPGDQRDVPVLRAIQAEPEVACWWGDPQPASAVAARLRGGDEGSTSAAGTGDSTTACSWTCCGPSWPGCRVSSAGPHHDREEKKTA